MKLRVDVEPLPKPHVNHQAQGSGLKGGVGQQNRPKIQTENIKKLFVLMPNEKYIETVI